MGLLVGAVLLLSAGAAIAAGSGSSPPAPNPRGVGGRWKVLLDDEFDRASLAGTRFTTGWPPAGAVAAVAGPTVDVNPGPVCDDPGQVTVAHGELDLTLLSHPVRCGGVTQPYATGLVTTKFTFNYRYGFAEARIWVPGSSTIADWPTWWALGYHWPRDGEIDILEGIGGVACWHFHNVLGAFGSCTKRPIAGGWHTFGSDWEPGSITWYYDGHVVGRVTTGITRDPMYLVLGLSPGQQGLVTPAVQRIHYVRVWQRG